MAEALPHPAFEALLEDRRPALEGALPFNLWLVQQQRARDQRRGRYKATGRENGNPHTYHTQKMPPDLCRRCLRHLRAAPGSVIFDPFLGTGTTVVEALEMGLRGIGCDVEERYLAHAAEPNIRAAARRLGLDGTTTPDGKPWYTFWAGDCRSLDGVLEEASVDHIVTSPPYGDSDPNVDSGGDALADRTDNRWMQRLKRSGHIRPVQVSPGNLGTRKVGDIDDEASFDHGLYRAMRAWRRVIKPGGFALVVVREYWDDTGMVDLPGRVMQIAKRANWLLHDQLYAVEAAMDQYGQLTSRASAHRHLRARKEASDGRPCPKGVPCVSRVCVLQRRAEEPARGAQT